MAATAVEALVPQAGPSVIAATPLVSVNPRIAPSPRERPVSKSVAQVPTRAASSRTALRAIGATRPADSASPVDFKWQRRAAPMPARSVRKVYLFHLDASTMANQTFRLAIAYLAEALVQFAVLTLLRVRVARVCRTVTARSWREPIQLRFGNSQSVRASAPGARACSATAASVARCVRTTRENRDRKDRTLEWSHVDGPLSRCQPLATLPPATKLSLQTSNADTT
jgi:hypothetical protein